MLFLRSRVISSTSASISKTWCLWSPFWNLQPSSSSSTSSSSSPPSQRPSQTPEVFDHRAEAVNKKIIVNISSTSASVKFRKSHLKKSYSIMTITTGFRWFHHRKCHRQLSSSSWSPCSQCPWSWFWSSQSLEQNQQFLQSPSFAQPDELISRPLSSYFQQDFCPSLLSFVRSFFVSTMKLGSKFG